VSATTPATAAPTASAIAVPVSRGTADSAIKVVSRPLDRFVTGMGEGADGELYVLTRTEFGPVGETGEVLKLIAP
jgi:hypothetical protein